MTGAKEEEATKARGGSRMHHGRRGKGRSTGNEGRKEGKGKDEEKGRYRQHEEGS